MAGTPSIRGSGWTLILIVESGDVALSAVRCPGPLNPRRNLVIFAYKLPSVSKVSNEQLSYEFFLASFGVLLRRRGF